MKAMNVDDMEDLFDDMADMMADMEEINDVMGRTYNCEFDEAELMGELDELDEEIVSEQLNEGLGLPSYIPNSQKADAVPSGGQPMSEDQALQNMMQL